MFNKLKTFIEANIANDCNANLFELNDPRFTQTMWERYLEVMDKGTIYKTRGAHDCSTCRHAFKNFATMFWYDTTGTFCTPFSNYESADLTPDQKQLCRDFTSAVQQLAEHNISDIVPYYRPFKTYGANRAGGFDHFYFTVRQDRFSRSADTMRGTSTANFMTSLRALTSISETAVDIVIELIDTSQLYRGDNAMKLQLREFKRLLQLGSHFKSAARYYNKSSWLATLRNSSLGQLLQALTGNPNDVDGAVAAYERMTAPENYQRPTAVVTQAMVKKAKETVESLGLTSALQRRLAYLDDLPVEHALFVDRNRDVDKDTDDPFAQVPTAHKAPTKGKANIITLQTFIDNVLPTAKTVEVRVENRLYSHMVTMTCAKDDDAPPLFWWGNNFSWSYVGDYASSAKDRVREKGGALEGALLARLAWNDTNDLDLAMVEPNGEWLYFGSKRTKDGMLDVDANAGSTTTTPVENIVYKKLSQRGTYTLTVNMFRVRNGKASPYTVEIELNGEVHVVNSVSVGTRMNTKQVVAKFESDGEGGITMHANTQLAYTTGAKLWNLPVEQFHRVKAITYSPNYFSDNESGTGQKHVFFFIEDCINETSVRGFYNEFLRSDLRPHRKVMELVGQDARAKEGAQQNQLSGLGFTFDKEAVFTVRVNNGNRNEVYTVTTK